jgi:hypothetical protein
MEPEISELIISALVLNNQTIEKGEHNSEEMNVEREKPVRRLPASRLLSFHPARGAFAFYP